MSGSSRTLLRAVTRALEAWDSPDWENSPSPAIRDVYVAIDAYIDKHTTLDLIGGSIHDGLRGTYERCIETAGDIAKEKFFLEILTRISGFLTYSETRQWLQTYLRPALDSAGYDLGFVAKARDFVVAVGFKYASSTDADLLRSRQANSKLAMGWVLKVYLGDSDALQLIGFDDFRDSHVHAERVRFVERNAVSILREWAVQQPMEFFAQVDVQLVNPNRRHKAVTLLSQLVNQAALQLHRMVDLPVFRTLLTLLAFDFSEALLSLALCTILMVVAKACHKLVPLLPDLYFVVFRLAGWAELSDFIPDREEHVARYLKRTGSRHEIVPSDLQGSVMLSAIFCDGHFDVLFLLTILYGLFPQNTLEFARQPLLWWSKHPPSITLYEYLKSQDAALVELGTNCADLVGSEIRAVCRSLLIHPNVVRGILVKQEEEDPLRWIIDGVDGDVGENEVLNACLGLNPSILPRELPPQKFETLKSQEEVLSPTIHPAATPGAASPSQQPLSANDAFYPGGHMALKRLSIVPTTLKLENKGGADSRVNFRSVDFGKSRKGSTEWTKDAVDHNSLDAIRELMGAHEKLFQLNSPVERPDTATGKFLAVVSHSTASDMLSRQLLHEKGADNVHDETTSSSSAAASTIGASSTTPPFSSGSALEFYQRELLLIKNEMEFTSYVKHLHRFNFLQLKLRCSLQLRTAQAAAEEASRSAVLAEEHLAAVAALDLLRDRHEQAMKKKDEDISKVEASLHEAHEAARAARLRFADMEVRLSDLTARDTATRQQLADMQRELENARSDNIQFKRASTNHNNININAGASGPVQGPPSPPASPALVSPIVDPFEKEKMALRAEIERLRAENSTLALEKLRARHRAELDASTHEARLAAAKNDAVEAVREQTAAYERRLRDAERVAANYEALLEAKDVRLAQLATAAATPASEHLAWLMTNARPRLGDERDRPPPQLLLLSGSIARIPQRPPLTPIIRGRGGYQKRSRRGG